MAGVKLLALGVLALLALALSSCDDDDPDDGGLFAPATTTPTASTATATASVTPTATPTPQPFENVCTSNPSPVDPDDPSIIVTSPVENLQEPLSSPIEVRGEARVFEANVSLALFNSAGEVLSESFATASAGGPEFGDFDALLAYAGVDEQSPACLWVFESSAEDGSPNNVVQIPIVLEPAPAFVQFEGGGWCPENPDPATAETFEVEQPLPGDSVVGAVRAQGNAAVFEASFLVRIYDLEGNVVMEQVATTAEGGVLSAFDVGVPFTVPFTQPGCVWLFEASPEDGSDSNIYAIPVHLAS
jgi:Immunoglobulin-like domain of bacterial spore germination